MSVIWLLLSPSGTAKLTEGLAGATGCVFEAELTTSTVGAAFGLAGGVLVGVISEISDTDAATSSDG